MKAILAALAAMLMCATSLHAQRGDLTLGWDNCRQSGAGAELRTFACNTNSNAAGSVHNLVGAFIAAPGIVSLNSADMSLLIQQPAGLRPWWQHAGPAGSCRGGNNLSADFTNAVGAACENQYWSTIAGGPFGGFSYSWPEGGIYWAELGLVVAVDNNAAAAVPPGQETYLFTVQILNGQTTGAGACEGCNLAACIAFTRAEMFQSNNDNFVITESLTPFHENQVIAWQFASGCDFIDPVEKKTWGGIKGLYR